MKTTTRWSGLGLAMLLGACSSGGSQENAAASTSFQYGTTQAATAAQAGAMGATVASLDAFRAAPGASAGLGATDAGSVSGALLTGSPIASFSPGEVGATSAAAFDVPACAVVTAGQVAFDHCRVTVDETSGTSTTKGSVTVNGQVALAADGQTLTWDLTYVVALTMGSSGVSSLSMSGNLHTAGKVVVTATTAVGSVGSEVSLTVSAGGRTATAGVDESLAFDVTRSNGCATGVTGGTLEAKRVWTTRPSDTTAATLPDEALKVEWTGCGAATVRAGTR
jgi:hypothetical protein